MHNHETASAREVFLLGALFMGYALLLWLVARRERMTQALEAVASSLDGNRLEFARTQRDRLIAEENDNAG